jgi:predicted GNAT family acetyltransferase
MLMHAVPSAENLRKSNNMTTSNESATIEVLDNTEGRFYELKVGDEVAGLLVYHILGSRLVFTHTMVQKAFQGRGLSKVLMGRALDEVRTKGLTVSSLCPVLDRFVEAHPKYADILTPHPNVLG